MMKTMSIIEQTTSKLSNIDPMFQKYEGLFKNVFDLSNTCGPAKHEIILERESPIFGKPTKIPHYYGKETEKPIQNYLKNGIIRKSKSPWNNILVMVPKKNGKKCTCFDFRPLNLKTVKDKYPPPRIDEIPNNFDEASHFSSLDVLSVTFRSKWLKTHGSRQHFHLVGDTRSSIEWRYGSATPPQCSNG